MTVDDLYTLPLGEFVAARDRLVKELSGAGDTSEASRVKALRKPTVAAWSLIHIAHEQPGLVGALVGSHQRLRSADSAPGLRSASESRMEAIARILDAADVSEAVRKKMRSTLLAAATEPGVADLLVAGHLEADSEPGGLGGFGLGAEFSVGSSATAPAEEVPAGTAQRRASAKAAKARERLAGLQEQAEVAAADARRLREEADRLERLAVDAEQRAAKAQAAAEKAADAVRTG